MKHTWPQGPYIKNSSGAGSAYNSRHATMFRIQAEIILGQLGGHKFKVMTGAKHLAFDEDGSLSFKLPRAKDGINYVKITLNGLDLYDMEFRRVTLRKGEIRNVLKAAHSNVYGDMIRGLFETSTGLRTSLERVYS